MDGLNPVLHHNVGSIKALQPRQDVSDDVRRLLGAGIVGGHHHEIRDLRGHGAHLGPLGPVSIAAAAEQGDGAPLGKALHRGQHVHHAVGAVGVINENGIVLSRGGNHLHAALHRGHTGQHRRALLQGDPQCQRRAHHIQRIIHHEPAGDVHPHGDTLRCRHGGKGHMVGLQNDLLRPQVCVSVLGVEEFLAGGLLQQPPGPGIVGVADAGAAGAEQDRLGVTVGLHGLMEIQMVLGQIREDAHRVRNAVDPVQRQGVGGDLHHHMAAAGVTHPREQLLHLKGLRGGALRGDHLIPDHILIRADQTNFRAQSLLQNRLQQIGGGGLAVGARHRDHGHLLRGMAEEVGAHHRQAPAGIRHLHIGDLPLRQLLTQDGRRAGGHRFFDIGMTVRGEAGHGHKQVAGLRLTGVIADVPDLLFRIHIGGEDLQAL